MVFLETRHKTYSNDICNLFSNKILAYSHGTLSMYLTDLHECNTLLVSRLRLLVAAIIIPLFTCHSFLCVMAVMHIGYNTGINVGSLAIENSLHSTVMKRNIGPRVFQWREN
ncbi:hypothetical protein BDB01DRAFT_839244 [Pilobolus umbonatus]|nr:hypothetical protein BDB01DRAFT_839244 [Pilobolus umbonatus]